MCRPRILKYTLAMARTSAPHSASSQFFINTKNNGFLNKAESTDGWGYAVFGKVVEGKEVVDAIEKLAHRRAGARTRLRGAPGPAFGASIANGIQLRIQC